MDEDDLWAAIDEQRARTADLLATLTEAQWQQPSLCPGWTVRDVAAHLTLQQVSLGEILRSAIRHPGCLGGLNRMIRITARNSAARPTDLLIADIRAMIGSRRHNVGVTSLETLIDILVHGQDIAVPLGLRLEAPPDATATAVARVWSYGGKGMARVFDTIDLAGLRPEADDIEWSAGQGRTIRGPVLAILLLLTGRRVALQSLYGEGADVLRQRLLTV